MLNIGTPELLVILIIALLVVGPQRLPELSRQLGRGLREFRKIQDDVKDMVKVDLDTPDAPPPSAPAGSPMAPGVHRTRRPAAADGTGADGNGAQDGAPHDGGSGPRHQQRHVGAQPSADDGRRPQVGEGDVGVGHELFAQGGGHRALHERELRLHAC